MEKIVQWGTSWFALLS